MKLNMEEVMTACQEYPYTGFCTACGESQDGVEPDAHNYKCESCGKTEVFGAEELLIMYGG